jgi:hypothetical protein
MARTLNTAGAALLARLQAGEQIPVVQLVQVDLSTTLYYACCGVPLVWAGQTWTPADIGISAVEDSATDMPNLTLTLPGVSSAQIAFAFDPALDGAPVHVYDALVDPATGVVADAIAAWSGELDIPGWQDGPEATVTFQAEHRGMIAARVKPSRYTNEEQQRLHPGDTSLDFDPATDATAIVWPAASFFKQ